jgi:hypothetical protein
MEYPMSKQTNTVALSTPPTSMKDAGYKQALIGEANNTVAAFVLDKCPGFLDDVPKEIKTELYAGFMLRKHELTGTKFYRLSDGVYIPVEKPAADDKGLVQFTIESAMSYSQQEFGRMRISDPAKRAVIEPLREAFTKYASNCMRDLTAKIRSIVNAGKPRERAPNAEFDDAMKKAFDSFEKRVKTAKERGDTTADPARFLTAVSAFWRVYRAE